MKMERHVSCMNDGETDMKWGILATGNIAHKFASTLRKMEDETLAACASRSMEKAEAFAQEFGIPKCFGSYEELVRCPDVEAVYVASPNGLHPEHVRLCLNGGKHVLCEKPLTVSQALSEELYGLAAAKNRFLMEGFWIRFLPLYEELQSVIKSGTIGEVVSVECSYGFVSSGPRRFTKLDPVIGGGALMDIGIYCLGFLHMMHAGEMHWKQGSVFRNEYGTDEESSFDIAWSDGCRGHVDLSLKREMKRTGRIAGTKGEIILPDFQQAVTAEIKPYEGEAFVIERPVEINGFEYEIRECSACVKNGRNASSVYTPEESISLIRLMDEIRASW